MPIAVGDRKHDGHSRHFLPEALVNYLSLLGWNPGDDREKMPIDEIVKLFDLPGVNQSNAKFDGKKLANMNMTYLLEQPADKFVALARAYFEAQATTLQNLAKKYQKHDEIFAKAFESNSKLFRVPLEDPSYFAEVMRLAQPKIKSIDEIAPVLRNEILKDVSEIFSYTIYFFTDDFAIDLKVKEKVMAKGDPKARLAELIATMRTADMTTDTAVEEAIKILAAKHGLGFGDYQAVARLAVTGTNAGPSITSIFRVLGRERVLARMERFLVGC